jgi:hypothetical protein
LIERFPTSETLFAWLKSPEGGSLSIRDTRVQPDDEFVIIHYTKDSDMSLEHVPYFRSVVWNAVTNQPVCVAPTKSLTTPPTSFTVVEDFVDGVMINMFWTKMGWRLATRTKLDAGNTFYSRRPFATLFMEAVAAAGLDLMSLSPLYTYSWVLQHPEERIVVAPLYGVPKLFLVEMRDSNLEVDHDPGRPQLLALMPKRHTLATVQDAMDRVQAWGVRFGAQWKGLMLKTNGARYSLTSDQYLEALALRGNVAKLPFVWLERFAEKKLNQYLTLYPEEANSATATVEAFKTCTQEAYDLYQQIYRRREFPLGQAPQKYRKLLWDIHAKRAGSYFPNLVAFMNEQDTARKLWLVNYEVRYAVNQQEVAEREQAQTPTDAALNQLADELEGRAAVNQQEAAEEADREQAQTQETLDAAESQTLDAYTLSEQPDSVS